MKKLLCIILSVALVALTLCACTDNKDKIDVDSLSVLKVGVPVGKEPSFSIFDAMYSRLANKGYKVEYIEFESAQQANEALANKEIDLSLIAQKTEFEEYNNANPEVLLNLGAVYRFPYGIFLCNFEEVEDITDGATIALPEDAQGLARALLLLEANGFIKLKKDAGLEATLDDIEENSRNFKFTLQNNEALVANIGSPEADIAVMSSQLCIDAGYALNRTARAIEDIDCDAAREYACVLLINRSDISSDWYNTVSPLFFSALMYETAEVYPGDLIVPAFNLSQKS